MITKPIMLVEALKVVLLFIMKNHVYTFNGSVYRQMKGGPIGLELTGVLAQIFMVWWDRRLKIMARTMGLQLQMYKRYVDDINIVMNIPELGSRFIDGVLRVVESEKDRYKQRDHNERCMSFLKSIANEIHPSIKVEVDHPANHSDGKIPILDVKVWVEKRDVEVDGVTYEANIVMHELYSKGISSKSVIHPRSALPFQSKRTIMTQEILRVLLNCSALLPWE